ncbi:disease resistance protein RGA2-like [Durio zibethinus]|uniref:Disease resistance protein RGA2-like n=1 Tax=Durio zibethinus TaxID=66656 RepID=A0A6P5Y0Z4_DURZI|nr:disease resistance protein RGA2-like [Durio zibethinus]
MAEAVSVAAKGIVSCLSSDVLHDAEDRQGRDRAIRRWLLKLQEVAYEADDVLDDLVYEDLRREIVINKPMCSLVWKQVCNFFSLSNPVLFHFIMANKVEEINASLDKIKNEGFVLGLRNRVGSVGRITEMISQDCNSDSILDSEPVGRRDDVSKIINMLSSLSNQHEISFISIVGMPGIGKTTLAKSVCKEVKEKKIFDVAIWVCVSDDFSHQKILGGMLESLDRSAGGMTNIDAILQNLRKELKDRSFLLILDDVWNEDCQKWRELKNRLSKINDNAGELSIQKKDKANAIVVTTRSQNVASIVETSAYHRHHLEKLSNEECWSIIKERACKKGRALISSDLEDIGRVIAEKCGGVPLLASVLGGTLGFTREQEKWLAMKNSDVWNLGNTDEVLPKLKLSFDNLPFCLKQCFAYCSIFPKDHVFEKDQLIQLWMAQGFLHSFEEITWSEEGGGPELEDIGDKIFNGLLSNSLFQDVERDTCGNIKTCKMHDVVYDLAQFVSKSEICASKLTTDISDHIRHINVAYDEELVPKITEDVAKKLRSLSSKVNVFNDVSRDLESLRVLNFGDAMINDLPAFLGRFKRLRYLDVSGSSITTLPQSMDRLYNLQTLRFMHCRYLKMLPKGILGNLVSLRHIYFNDKKLMPVEIGSLPSLRTLPLFVVGVEIGFQVKELGNLNQLRGELRICNLEYVKDREDARGAKLEEKTNIYKLIYEWSSEREGFDNDEEEVNISDVQWSYKSFNYDEEMLDDLQSYSSDHSFSQDEMLDDDLDETEGLNHDEDLLVSLEPHLNPKRSYVSGFFSRDKVLDDDLDESEGFNHDEDLLVSLRPHSNPKRSYVSKFNHDEVLKGLKPPPNLKSLSIRNSRGKNFPSWVWRSINSGCSDSSLLNNLVELNLFNCMNCKSLPTLGKLPNLKILEIKRMKNVRCIGSEFYCDHSDAGVYEVLFPALKELTIEDMEALEKWMDPTFFSFGERMDPTFEIVTLHGMGTSDQKVKPTDRLVDVVFPCLEELTIGCCPELRIVPMMGGLPSLQTLKIYSCKELRCIADGLSASTRLRKINIQVCHNLGSIPDIGRLPFLKEIKLEKCRGLSSLPMGISYCTSLENLSIHDCPCLTCIPNIIALSSLRILILNKCEGLRQLPRGLEFCSSLEQLDIVANFNLEVFPGDLRQLCSLRFLNITICPNLKTFPKECLGCFSSSKVLTMGGFSEKLHRFPGLSSIHHLHASLDCLLLLGWKRLKHLPDQLQHLTALKRLEIWSFDGVVALPDWLGNMSSLQSLKIHQCEKLMLLPSTQAMQQLTQLKRLFIHNCPKLSRRCAKETGAEWSKISDISEVIIKNDN